MKRGGVKLQATLSYSFERYSNLRVHSQYSELYHDYLDFTTSMWVNATIVQIAHAARIWITAAATWVSHSLKLCDLLHFLLLRLDEKMREEVSKLQIKRMEEKGGKKLKESRPKTDASSTSSQQPLSCLWFVLIDADAGIRIAAHQRRVAALTHAANQLNVDIMNARQVSDRKKWKWATIKSTKWADLKCLTHFCILNCLLFHIL